MTKYWVLKTEPSTYSFDDLVRAGRAVWDGVTNPVALKHIRTMARGDDVLIYHTGDEKTIVGFARVVSAPYPDPNDTTGKLTVVDLAPGERLPRPVPLSAIKAEPKLKDLALVRMPRLSVVPVDGAQWRVLLGMGGKGSE